MGGTLANATVTAGSKLALSNSGGTLAGLTVEAGVTVDGTGGGANASVTSGLILNGEVDLGLPNGNTSGALYFQGSQALMGSGTVVLGGSPGNGLFAQGDGGSRPATLTIASGITVQGGSGFVSGYYGGDSFVNNGTITVPSGGTVTVARTWTNNGTVLAQNGGTLSASTPTNYSNGILTGGTWAVFANSTLRVVMSSGIITNAATILLADANSNFYSSASDPTDALANTFATNAAAGSFTVQDGRNFTTPRDFRNNGTLAVGANSTFTVRPGNTYTQTGGSTTLQGGTLQSALVDIQGGSLSGSGTISGSLRNNGEIDVGGVGAAGLLRVTGNYEQTAAGVLNIKIGGLAQDSEYDHLDIRGTARLAGTLNVTLIGGFRPDPGPPDSFRILTFGSRLDGSDFDTKNGLDLGGGLFFDPQYDDTGLTLVTMMTG
jgi:hypothetical protein